MNNILLTFEIIGTIAFSISGATLAIKKDFDILGVLLLGATTAFGGGITRDIILGELPPSIFERSFLVWISLVSSLIIFILFSNHVNIDFLKKSLLISDSLGLGAFTVTGITVAIDKLNNHSVIFLVFIAVVTSCGGGVIRDIFAGEVPALFTRHFYATASIIGALFYLLIVNTNYILLSSLITIVVVFVLRIMASYYGWNLPKVKK